MNLQKLVLMGDCPDVIRLYLLSIQSNHRLPPLCDEVLKLLKYFFIRHFLKILFFTKFYILQVAFGRKAHIGIAPSSS